MFSNFTDLENQLCEKENSISKMALEIGQLKERNEILNNESQNKVICNHFIINILLSFTFIIGI